MLFITLQTPLHGTSDNLQKNPSALCFQSSPQILRKKPPTPSSLLSGSQILRTTLFICTDSSIKIVPEIHTPSPSHADQSIREKKTKKKLAQIHFPDYFLSAKKKMKHPQRR